MPTPRPATPAVRLVAVVVAALAAAGALGAADALPAAPAAAELRPAETPPAELVPPLPLHTIVVRPRPVAPTISLSLRDADLVEVLRTFARLGGFDLVVDPAVSGKVTVELRDVRWQDALVVILRSQGLAAEVEGRIVSVRPLPLAVHR
jgi:type II secretory pathway component HofQ